MNSIIYIYLFIFVLCIEQIWFLAMVGFTSKTYHQVQHHINQTPIYFASGGGALGAWWFPMQRQTTTFGSTTQSCPLQGGHSNLTRSCFRDNGSLLARVNGCKFRPPHSRPSAPISGADPGAKGTDENVSHVAKPFQHV